MKKLFIFLSLLSLLATSLGTGFGQTRPRRVGSQPSGQSTSAPTPPGQTKPDPKTALVYSGQWNCLEQFQSGLKSTIVTNDFTTLIDLSDGACKELNSCTITADTPPGPTQSRMRSVVRWGCCRYRHRD